jgi:ABC-type Zn2+ transport system substrate-binding protein/surface adhesin
MHEHEHDHHHEHHHDHDHHDHAPNKTHALLEYMVEHNKSHAVELKDLAEKIALSGDQKSADLLSEGVKSFEQGNAKLAEVLEQLHGGLN